MKILGTNTGIDRVSMIQKEAGVFQTADSPLLKQILGNTGHARVGV